MPSSGMSEDSNSVLIQFLKKGWDNRLNVVVYSVSYLSHQERLLVTSLTQKKPLLSSQSQLAYTLMSNIKWVTPRN